MGGMSQYKNTGKKGNGKIIQIVQEISTQREESYLNNTTERQQS